MFTIALISAGTITGAVVSEEIGFIDSSEEIVNESNITNHTLGGNRSNINPIEKKPEQTPEETLPNPENSSGEVHLSNVTENETSETINLPPNNTSKQLPEEFLNNIEEPSQEVVSIPEDETVEKIITEPEPTPVAEISPETITPTITQIDNFDLKNSKRKTVSAQYEIITDSNIGIASDDSLVNLKITPENSPIKEIRLNDLNLNNENDLGFEELPKDFPSPLGSWAQVYALNPENLDFTDGLVTVEAKGINLYKCKDYDFEQQDCYGEWALFQTNLTPGETYTFILTAEDPVFGEEVSTCDAENSAGPGVFASACDAADGSLLESDNSLVETQTYGKGGTNFGGLRIQTVNTSITNCGSIDSVLLCYERWATGTNTQTCDVSVDANGGLSYTAVTNTCPGAAANPGVTCTDVTGNGEIWTCANFFGAAGTRAFAKMEMERTTAGAPSTETVSTDVFFFNVTYNEAADIIGPNITFTDPTPNTTSLQLPTFTINATLTDETAVGSCLLEFDGANESMTETTISGTEKQCSVTKTSLADGSYTFQVYGNDTSNNLNWTESRTVTVDGTNPTIIFVDPTDNASTYQTRTNILTNVTATDTNIANITTYLYNASNLVLLNTTINTTASPHFVNFTDLVDGTYLINATAVDNVGNSNDTVTRTNIIIDTTTPLVFDLIPIASTAYNASTIEIAANVTEVNIDTVLANITFPNSTIEQITLSLDSGEKYNGSFTAPTLPGNYNVTIIANDSVGFVNNSETTNFTINDIYPPSVNITIPAEGSNFAQDTDVIINVNVTDQLIVETVLANITLPNTTIIQETLTDDDANGIYNVTFNQTSAVGTYTILILANDTDGNLNNTETRDFNIQESAAPLVTLVSPADTSSQNSSTVIFTCNATDAGGLFNFTLYHNLSGTFTANETIELNGTTNQTSFTINNVADGQHLWNCLVTDNSTGGGNSAFAVNNFTVTVDTVAPAVTLPQPDENTNYSLGNTVNLNVTVIDVFTVSSVLANVTLPNGTINQITLTDSDADDIYNSTYTTQIIGRHNVTFIATDSVTNINSSVTTFFNVTQVPNISLLNPANNAILTDSLVEFNFTVSDDDASLTNCSLYNNITGTWQRDTTIFDVSNSTTNNITKYMPDGKFIWNIECVDSAGFSNFSETNYTVTVNTT
ncbi:hypothetical protein HOC32_02600, partial [Candidatus Woesearchaeota archaeon]|nr:hypothetical protein [Candidatus Woesearchaeota archaeon]